MVGAEVYAPLAPVLELSLGAFRGSPVRQHLGGHGPCGSSFRLAAIIVRCGSLLGPGPFARPGSREVGVGVPFARFGRPLSWRIACSDSNGRGPAGLPARPAVFTTDSADAHPPHAVSPTALEELWSKRDRRLTSFVALRARITGSSRLTAAFRRAAPRGAACRGIHPLGQTRLHATR